MSDGLVSYNLPLNGKEGDEAGNYFTDTIARLMNNEYKDKNGKDIKLPDDFKNSTKTILNKIKDEAAKLKETSEKNYNDQLKRLNIGNDESE